MRLTWKMLMSTNLRTRSGASQTVQTIIQNSPVIQCVPIKDTQWIDVGIPGTNITHQCGRRQVHVVGEKGRHIAIGLMFDADCVTIGHAHMPGLT